MHGVQSGAPVTVEDLAAAFRAHVVERIQAGEIDGEFLRVVERLRDLKAGDDAAVYFTLNMTIRPRMVSP